MWYLNNLLKKAESDMEFANAIYSLPNSESLLSDVKLVNSNIELFEVVRKPVPQGRLLVKIINSTFEGEVPKKSNYTCVTFDLRWPTGDLINENDGSFDSKISKGTTSYC